MPMKPGSRFAAIDFETATQNPNSACAVALVFVENGEIVERYHRLIQPPERDFEFTYLHGIAWQDVADQPAFAGLYRELAEKLESVPVLVAHNAPFDRGVLEACCAHYALPVPSVPFECTVQMARRVLRIYPTKLNMVCAKLGIPLQHHNALSDAEACARIVLECWRKSS